MCFFTGFPPELYQEIKKLIYEVNNEGSEEYIETITKIENTPTDDEELYRLGDNLKFCDVLGRADFWEKLSDLNENKNFSKLEYEKFNVTCLSFSRRKKNNLTKSGSKFNSGNLTIRIIYF